MNKRLRITVQGYVQGVGFRYFTLQKAHSLGITGYVKNIGHNQVEVLAEGDASTLQRFIDILRQGPIGSRIDEVLVKEEQAKGGSADFTIEF